MAITWSEEKPAGDANKDWYLVSISGDKMIAGVYGSRLYSGSVVSSSSIKTINSLAKASVKTVNGLAIASVKTINGLA